jgi:hypothetical protein
LAKLIPHISRTPSVGSSNLAVMAAVESQALLERLHKLADLSETAKAVLQD